MSESTDFCRVLEIDASFLEPEDYKALGIAQWTWVELGMPTDRVALAKALERAIRRSASSGVRYCGAWRKREPAVEGKPTVAQILK